MSVNALHSNNSFWQPSILRMNTNKSENNTEVYVRDSFDLTGHDEMIPKFNQQSCGLVIGFWFGRSGEGVFEVRLNCSLNRTFCFFRQETVIYMLSLYPAGV